MAARLGRLSKPDSQGQYARQLGWKLSQNGSRVQHKFRLGADKGEAERRDDRLRQVWEAIEKSAPVGGALWDDTTLDIAKQLARGADQIELSPVSENEIAEEYARRLQSIQNRFPFLRFVPCDTERYTIGVSDKAIDLREIVLFPSSARDDYWRGKEYTEMYQALPLLPNRDDGVIVNRKPLPEVLPTQPLSLAQPNHDGATLHQAFEAYKSWIKEQYVDEVKQAISDYGFTKLGQVDTLESRHGDVPLAQIDYDFIEKMYRYWRQRPLRSSRNGEEERISHSSIRHYIGELHRFFKWLHRSKDFTWRKPDDFDEIDRSIPLDTDSVKKRIRNVDTFQLDELRLLNRYASPIERLYLMLGLNCGFGAKEIATLTIGELFLYQALPAVEQEVFGFTSSSADSFVTLVRNKTTIVGKYLLFPQIVQMLEWILARRLKQPNATSDHPLILNRNGMPLDQRSDNGNPSRQIPNAFDRLLNRIQDDDNQITKLPFKYVRKTAGDLIRRFSDGEVSGVFLLHGSPVSTDKLSDVYTNRPFGKVYEAIRQLEEYLQPVFAEAGHDPTLEKPQAYTSRKSIDRIAELKQEGRSIREIANATGKSRTTVHRHLQRLREQSPLC